MNENDLNDKIAGLEALLFVHGEPLSLKIISKNLNFDGDELSKVITEFQKKLESGDRGLTLVTGPDKIQLTTKPKFGKLLETFVKSELTDDLSPASLETLAIICYFGPISRAMIEYHRGVNSSFILRNLLIRGLIHRTTSNDNPNAFVYEPSFDLVKHLGLSKKEDLPDYGKFRSLLESFEKQESNLTSE
jgi:segregation and condensation protein B